MYQRMMDLYNAMSKVIMAKTGNETPEEEAALAIIDHTMTDLYVWLLDNRPA